MEKRGGGEWIVGRERERWGKGKGGEGRRKRWGDGLV